jgi:hypothetical protein
MTAILWRLDDPWSLIISIQISFPSTPHFRQVLVFFVRIVRNWYQTQYETSWSARESLTQSPPYPTATTPIARCFKPRQQIQVSEPPIQTRDHCKWTPHSLQAAYLRFDPIVGGRVDWPLCPSQCPHVIRLFMDLDDT